MGLYRHAVRPLLFRCDPEWAHERVIGLAAALGRSRLACRLSEQLHRPDPRLAVTVGGGRFASPLGLAAGFETNTGRPAARDEVIGQFVTAARSFAGVADYLALNLNCPNTAAGHSIFDHPAAVRDLLAALAAVERLPPVFLKVTATTDPARIE